MSEKLLKFIEHFGPTLLASLAILIFGLLISKLILKFISKALKKSHLEPTGHAFLLSIIRVVLYLIVVIMSLTKLGVPMTSIVAMITAAGLAVSLAVKENLSDVAGGFIIMFSRPFKVGDYIRSGENEGTVTAITIMHTKLLTLDTRAVLIPNSSIVKNPIINNSAMPQRRLEMHFPISYSEQFGKARTVILDALKTSEFALHQPDEPLVAIWSLDESSVNIILRVWIHTKDYWPARFELTQMIKEAFDENGITIPFNQLDVHFDSEPPKAAEQKLQKL